MGKKSKGSRKGKKAWRANISTAEIEDFFEKTTKDALSGGSLSAVPSDSLFVVDKSRGIAASIFLSISPSITMPLLTSPVFVLVLPLLGSAFLVDFDVFFALFLLGFEDVN